MKPISTALIIIMLTLFFSSSAQIHNDTLNILTDYELKAAAYQKKSHNQKVTSQVLGLGGVILLGTGTALALSSLSGLFEPGTRQHNYGSAPDILSIGGGAMIGIAIPYAIAYRINKKKAKSYMQKGTLTITPAMRISSQFTAAGVVISL